jgi:hypothetical protein
MQDLQKQASVGRDQAGETPGSVSISRDGLPDGLIHWGVDILRAIGIVTILIVSHVPDW